MVMYWRASPLATQSPLCVHKKFSRILRHYSLRVHHRVLHEHVGDEVWSGADLVLKRTSQAAH